jgi:protein phosphatase
MIASLTIAALTNTGLVRRRNEDALLAGTHVLASVSMDTPSSWRFDAFPVILAVADGIGGSVAGDVASREVLSCLARLPCPDGEKMLTARIYQAQDHLSRLVAQSPDLDGLGTTLAGVLFLSERLIIFSCGDSRVYMRDAGAGNTLVRCMTRDHSYVQEMIDSGRLTEKEARSHPLGHVITSCLSGGRRSQIPDIRMSSHTIKECMRLVLCTDGVWDYGGEQALQAVSSGDPVSAAQKALNICYDAGAPDNITLIIADVHCSQKQD